MKNSEEVLKKIDEITNLQREVTEQVVKRELEEAKEYGSLENFLKSIVGEENFKNEEITKKKLIDYYMENIPYMGYCHKFWDVKKNLLKNKYQIDWYTPSEENPDIIYD